MKYILHNIDSICLKLYFQNGIHDLMLLMDQFVLMIIFRYGSAYNESRIFWKKYSYIFAYRTPLGSTPAYYKAKEFFRGFTNRDGALIG